MYIINFTRGLSKPDVTMRVKVKSEEKIYKFFFCSRALPNIVFLRHTHTYTYKDFLYSIPLALIVSR